jgi:hypothetical protein
VECTLSASGSIGRRLCASRSCPSVHIEGWFSASTRVSIAGWVPLCSSGDSDGEGDTDRRQSS